MLLQRTARVGLALTALVLASAFALRASSDSRSAATGAPQQDAANTSLAGWVGEPDAYVEIFDLSELEATCHKSGLGRVCERLAPILREGFEANQVFDDVDVHSWPFGAGTGTGWRESLRRALDESGGLGLSTEERERLIASIGPRISFSLQMRALAPGETRAPHEADEDDDDDDDESSAEPDWAVSCSLLPGGAELVENLILPRLALGFEGELTCERISPPRGPGASTTVWKLHSSELGEQFAVVRPELLVWTASAGLAESLKGAARPAATSSFLAARGEARSRHEQLWAWMRADGFARNLIAEEPDAAEALKAMGIDQVQNLTLGICESEGQLASRLRIARRGRAGLLGLVRGARSEWKTLELVSSDAIAVAGCPRSVVDVAQQGLELAKMAGEDADELAQIWAVLGKAPGLGAMLEPGALGSESLVFVRPGSAGLPMVYAALPAQPRLASALQALESVPESSSDGFTLKSKTLEGQVCFVLARPGDGEHSQSVAFCRQGGSVLASDSLLSLQSYLRQRSRERIAEREALIAEVRRSLERASVGVAPESVAGFLHVRTEPLTKFVWPFAMMGLSMAGIEGLEDLPDAVELAHTIGDTTLLLIDTEDAIEVRGRGMLGGLGFLF